MTIVFASAYFAFALAAVAVGVVTEYRQTRADGPVAIVCTMHWSPTATIFTLLGLLFLRRSLEWWWFLSIPLAVLLISGWAIMLAGKRRA
jgi:hypothetical protein